MATNITFLKMELAENEALAKIEKVDVVTASACHA